MRILVIGDACIDEYRFGDITRVNPESTAPLLTYHTTEERLCNIKCTKRVVQKDQVH
jgi:bifunctional ADP-heptose synthase (sugar kinase/adenylyltransferase)